MRLAIHLLANWMLRVTLFGLSSLRRLELALEEIALLLKLINRIMFILLVNLLILLILIQELGYLTSLQMEREIFLFANLMNLVILFGLKV